MVARAVGLTTPVRVEADEETGVGTNLSTGVGCEEEGERGPVNSPARQPAAIRSAPSKTMRAPVQAIPGRDSLLRQLIAVFPLRLGLPALPTCPDRMGVLYFP